MATVPETRFVTVGEYLRTTFSPDCDYVDGEIQERNVGEKPHSKVQRKLIVFFDRQGLHVFPEQQIRVAPTRFRVPDVCVCAGKEPDEDVFTEPPFIVVEILSPEDRMSRMTEKVADFLQMGVTHVWIVDPIRREGYRCDAAGLHVESVLKTADPDIVLRVEDLFA